jgi:hypothetical protein
MLAEPVEVGAVQYNATLVLPGVPFTLVGAPGAPVEYDNTTEPFALSLL